MIIAGLAGIVAGLSVGVAAVVAVVKGERLLVPVAPPFIGAMWAMLLLAEFLSPHQRDAEGATRAPSVRSS